MNKETDLSLFIGPLPKEVYDAVTNEFNLFRQDRVVEFAARALYGYKINQAYTDELKERADVLGERVAVSEIDGLTGVFRRDVMYHQLQNMICGFEMKRRGSDPEESLAVIVFDVENFKEVSDRSWEKGNAALEEVGKGLLSMARSSKGDWPGRIGGDEFLLILPYNRTDTTPRQLMDSFEDRIRTDLPLKLPNTPSLRWHHAFYQFGDDAESLISRAYPKGENKSLTRSHSQSDSEYQQAKQKAIDDVLPKLFMIREA